jgi:hypothetical protein
VTRNAARTIALLLLLVLTPGVGEAVENLCHLVAEGHLAHGASHDEEAPHPGAEHGCSGTFHLCACHRTLSFLATGAVLRPPLEAGTRLPKTVALPLAAGFHRIPEEPPNVV